MMAKDKQQEFELEGEESEISEEEITFKQILKKNKGNRDLWAVLTNYDI